MGLCEGLGWEAPGEEGVRLESLAGDVENSSRSTWAEAATTPQALKGTRVIPGASFKPQHEFQSVYSQ